MFPNRLFTLGLAVALTGCTTASYSPDFVDPMPDAEYAQLQQAQSKPATGSVFAKVYVTGKWGIVTPARGSNVLMWPATPYTERKDKESASEHMQAGQADPRINPYTRRTSTDNAGYFHFKNVPPGAYLVWSSVELPPEPPARNYTTPNTQVVTPSGVLTFFTQRIVVVDGEESRVYLTNH